MVLGNLILSGFPRTMDIQNHRSPGKAGGDADVFFFFGGCSSVGCEGSGLVRTVTL